MKDKIWQTIKDEVTLRIEAEPSLKPYLETLVISKKSLISSVAAILSSKLNSDALKSSDINDFILDVYENCDGIEDNIVKDLLFFKNHDPACRYFSTPILFYKGFQGLATYRAANCLWKNDRHTMALFLQNRASEIFGVDIHPAAKIKGGVMIDHATGVVIGETAEIQENAAILIAVGANDEVYMDGRRIDVRQVKANVVKMLADNPQGSVVIQADERAVADTIIKVMDGAREAGVNAISLASEPK